MDISGRPPHSDEQYQIWLNEMAPFLQLGNSLYYAMEKANLIRNKDSIYRKCRLNDWFCEKIHAFQSYPGEVVNTIFSRIVFIADEKIKRGEPISKEEWRALRFFAEKHRSSQPFFVQRYEVAQVEPDKIGKLLDEIEVANKTDYAKLANEASKSLIQAKISL